MKLIRLKGKTKINFPIQVDEKLHKQTNRKTDKQTNKQNNWVKLLGKDTTVRIKKSSWLNIGQRQRQIHKHSSNRR